MIFYRRDLDDVYCYYYNQPIAIQGGYEDVHCVKKAFQKLHPFLRFGLLWKNISKITRLEVRLELTTNNQMVVSYSRFLLAVLFFLTIALVILAVAFLIVHLLISYEFNTDWNIESWKSGGKS